MLLVIPVFVPHAGCPHDCIFCNQKVISGQKTLPGKDEIAANIAEFRQAAARYDEVQIAFFGGSFTAIDGEAQEHYLSAAEPFLKKNGGFADCIRISTRPDAIDADVIERLRRFSVKIVELGAQSMDDEVLRLSERGHTAEDTVKASKLLKENGFTLGLQTMTGLPGADEESDLETARRIAKLRPDLVRIYPTIVVKQTALFREYAEGRYVPQTVEQAVERCSKLCRIYTEKGIRIARIGLQSTDTISTSSGASEVAAGPYHEAFGQLVRSFDAKEAAEEAVEEILEKHKATVKKLGTLTLAVAREYVSDAVGQKRSNLLYLKERFGFRNVKISSGKNEEAADGCIPEAAGKFAYRLARPSGVLLISRRFKDEVFTDITVKIDFLSLR